MKRGGPSATGDGREAGRLDRLKWRELQVEVAQAWVERLQDDDDAEGEEEPHECPPYLFLSSLLSRKSIRREILEAAPYHHHDGEPDGDGDTDVEDGLQVIREFSHVTRSEERRVGKECRL